MRLAFLSMAITEGLVAVVGVWALHLSLGASVLLGEILAPTDPIPRLPPFLFLGNRFLVPHRAYTDIAFIAFVRVRTRNRVMSKVRQSNKEPKKHPLLT
jgi:hypothetical protein